MINFVLSNGNLPALIKQLERLDVTQRWSVRISEWKSKRSLDQNARYWKLIDEFGAYLGYDKDEMHQLMGYKFLRYEKNGRQFIKSTTKLTTAEMAEYQSHIERIAAEQGFIFEE